MVVRHGRRTTAGTATILLHGGAGSWTTWTPLLSAADSAAAEDASATTLKDLVISDLPGWGDTPLPPDAESLTVEVMADAIVEIARSLGYNHWIVIGHSMGGFIALQLAYTDVRATTFAGLISGTTFSVIDSVRHPVARFTELPAFTALLQIMKVLSLFETTGRRIIRSLNRMSLLRPIVAPLFSHPARVDKSVIDALATEVRARACTIASARTGGYNAELAWSRIECPVRASYGDRDVFVAETDGQRLGAVAGDFEVQSIAGSEHFGHVERPYETLSALLGRPRPRSLLRFGLGPRIERKIWGSRTNDSAHVVVGLREFPIPQQAPQHPPPTQRCAARAERCASRAERCAARAERCAARAGESSVREPHNDDSPAFAKSVGRGRVPVKIGHEARTGSGGDGRRRGR